MTQQRPLDPDSLKMFSYTVFSRLEGAVTAGMIHLGDQLGLYEVLAASSEGETSMSLASKAHLHERWVREWLHNQVAAHLIQCSNLDDPEPAFHLSPEAVAVLATPEHPAYGMGMFHRLPQTMAALKEMPSAFSTGIGFDYDSHGPEGAVGIERSFEPWNQAFLVPLVLPVLTGVIDKLQKGSLVADIGCGAGGAALLLGRAFPASSIDGFDISRHALQRAEERRSEENATNVSFRDPRESPIAQDGRYDLICTFDCIHDMTRPTEMMTTIRKALKPDGTWLLVDIKAHDSLSMNITKNPMAALLYGISVLSCMSSAMSEPDGEGLGTLGLSAVRAEEMARDAGFGHFRRLDIDHSINAFYEVRI